MEEEKTPDLTTVSGTEGTGKPTKVGKATKQVKTEKAEKTKKPEKGDKPKKAEKTKKGEKREKHEGPKPQEKGKPPGDAAQSASDTQASSVEHTDEMETSMPREGAEPQEPTTVTATTSGVSPEHSAEKGSQHEAKEAKAPEVSKLTPPRAECLTEDKNSVDDEETTSDSVQHFAGVTVVRDDNHLGVYDFARRPSLDSQRFDFDSTDMSTSHQQLTGDRCRRSMGTTDTRFEEGEENPFIDDHALEPPYLVHREDLEDEFQQLRRKKKYLSDMNALLQTKLAEYFRKKKADTTEGGGVVTKHEFEREDTEEMEQRYSKFVANLDDLRCLHHEQEDQYNKEIAELKEHCSNRRNQLESQHKVYMTLKHDVGIKAVNSKSGRPIPSAELQELLENEERRLCEVRATRLQNIKLHHKLKKEESALKSKEEMAEGLHLIDFEQLKIENQTYNEKIEERNEEVGKLKRKVANNVQILAHVKEKLNYVQSDVRNKAACLHKLDEEMKDSRDTLATAKLYREKLRTKNAKLKRTCGLLGNKALLRDYERSDDAVKESFVTLQKLRTSIVECNREAKGYLKRIEKLKNRNRRGMTFMLEDWTDMTG